MPLRLKDKGFVSLLVIVVLLFLGAIGVGIVYLNNNIKHAIKPLPALVPIPSKLPEKVVTSSANPASLIRSSISPKVKYILERQNGNKLEELFAVSNEALLEIERWKNLLIFSDGGQNDNGYPPDIQIKIQNIDTGKTDIIFDNFKSGSEFTSKKSPDTLSNLQMIEDTLYFSLGGYLKEGVVFWLDLPPVGKPQKLITVRNGSISKLRDWYFVIGGEGDSCWSERDFYLLDTKMKTTKKVATSKAGCNQGEEALGLSNEGKLILANHRGDGVSADGIYTDVTSLDIFNPDVKKTLISAEQMPEKIKRILYSEERDQLLIMGEGVYLYDVGGSRLDKITGMPGDTRLYPADRIWEKDKVCFEGEEGLKYELNLSSKTLTKVTEFTCSVHPEKGDFVKLIDSLQLPPNYHLIGR